MGEEASRVKACDRRGESVRITRRDCVVGVPWVQRVAVSTAANMCRQLPSDAADFVTEAVPLLTNLLQYQDSKVRVWAWKWNI